MKFNQTFKTNHYNSLNEMQKDYKRDSFVNQYFPLFNKIKQKLFDSYDVEKMYLSGNIIEKNHFTSNDFKLIVEINKENFDKLVDSYYIQHLYDKYNIIFEFNVQNIYYTYNNKWLIKEKSNSFGLLL